MRNFKLTIEYDGTRYQGWQKPGRKDNPGTVSGKITEILQRMTGETIELTGSTKTEPGVHACAQTAHFKTNTTASPQSILEDLNHYLPQDISVLTLEEVSPRFHAALNPQSRTYLYRINCTPVENVFQRKYCYFLPSTLDLDAMRQAADFLTGKHDFRYFSSGKNKKSTEKELFSVDIISCRTAIGLNPFSETSEIQILLKGSDFLHQMPLFIVGTLLDVGIGKRNPDCITAIFDGLEKPGNAAAAHGLFLKEIEF